MSGVLLFGYAALLAGPVAWLLRRSPWVNRTPALGVVAWQVLSGTVLIAAVLGAFAAIPPAHGDHDEHDHLAVVEACLVAVVFVGVVGVSLGWGLAAYIRKILLQRRWHRQVLSLVGRQDDRLGVVVLDHGSAMAYCVPGAGSRVVLTTAALAALDDPALAAVLLHERAHLAGRHDLVVAAGRVMRLAFPFVPAFRWGHDEVGRLVELIADDAAARRCGRRALADALVTLAESARPVPLPIAFSAAGSAVSARVKRLLSPAQPLGRQAVAVLSLGLLAVLALPVAVAAPALGGVADLLSHCPFA